MPLPLTLQLLPPRCSPLLQVLQPTPLRSLMAAVVASGVEQAAVVRAAVSATVIAPAQAATAIGSTLP